MTERVHAVGVDLAWGDNPTGVAHLVGPVPGAAGDDGGWRLLETSTLPHVGAVAAWIGSRVPSDAPVWVAVDAPLLATNPPGTQRAADLALSADFRRFRVTCLPVDVRHAERGGQLRTLLAEQGITHGLPSAAGEGRRGVFETFPTAAQLSLFDLTRPIRYKRGPIEVRREGLRSLQMRIAMLDDAALPVEDTSALKLLLRTDPATLQGGRLKALEDEIDALLCAFVAALAWRAPGRLIDYGERERGAIVVPHPPVPL